MTQTPRTRGIDGPAGSAEVLDEGALVLRWTPAGGSPALFVHPSAPLRSGVPPHAGVPVCWPWFGPGPQEGAPSHGIARTATWRHVATTTQDGASTVEYVLTDADVSSPFWAQPFRLELTAHVAEVLHLTLATTNTGGEPMTVGEALHAYLAVGDVREVTIGGLDGVGFHDKTTGTDEVQSGDLVLDGETDRVYRSSAPVTVSDPVVGRLLRVESTGAAQRIVWNPWSEKAEELADVDQAWPRFVCVEAGNVLEEVVTIGPGQTHTMTYRLSVEDL